MMAKKTKKENRLVVGDRSWAESIPEWLLEKVREERMVLGLISIANPNIEKVGDAEVLAYLLPAASRAPLNSVHTNIYLYLATKICGQRGNELPDDIQVIELSSWEEKQLQELKNMIYRCRGGDIQHPVLEAMRKLKKTISKETKSNNKTLFDNQYAIESFEQMSKEKENGQKRDN